MLVWLLPEGHDQDAEDAAMAALALECQAERAARAAAAPLALPECPVCREHLRDADGELRLCACERREAAELLED